MSLRTANRNAKTGDRARASASDARGAGAVASAADRDAQLGYVAENLLSRSAVLVRLLVKQVRSKEISRTEMQVLGILGEAPRSISELTELEGTAQPTMTLLVKRLEQRGWVQREGMPDDRRVVIVALTDDGAQAYASFRAQFLAAMRADLQELTDPELRELVYATETIAAFVDGLRQRV
jgi:DNA-binding MarR family transcriptional regulator